MDNIPADPSLDSQLRTISFIASLNDEKRSFKEFFLMVDALIPLEWKVEFTFLKKMYCCGAEKTCPLPKWNDTEAAGTATEESYQKSVRAFEFISEYFHSVVTRDDLFLIKHQFPLIYEFYRENSHRMMIGSLDNNGLLRQAPLIMRDMRFNEIDSIKLGSYFLQSEKVAEAAFNAIKMLAEGLKIHSVSMAEPSDPVIAAKVHEIKAWCDWCKIPAMIMSQDALEGERRISDGTGPLDDFEYYEEHALFFVQDKFYLTKYESTANPSNTFYEVVDEIDPVALLAGMVRRKIAMYGENMSRAKGRILDYFTWINQNAKTNDQFTFIPRFMINTTSRFYRSLLKNHKFTEVPPGLLATNSKHVIPMISF